MRYPSLGDTLHGIFATRHPCRPNGIGLSIVKLLGRDGNLLHVSGIDVLDGTPLIDIKPYVPRFDSRTGTCAILEHFMTKMIRRFKSAGHEIIVSLP